METDGTKLFNFIWIQWNRHSLTFTSFETFAIRSDAAFWQRLVYFLIQWIQSYAILYQIRCHCVPESAEKEIENQTQISVFSLLALFNGKSQRKIEMRVKIKKNKNQIRPKFHKLKFIISTRKMRPCNRKKVKKGNKKQKKRNQTNTQQDKKIDEW